MRRGPVILATTQGTRKTVADFSPQLSGLQIGMPVQAAVAAAGNARVIEADEAHQRREFQDVLRALQQRCPSVQPDQMGCAYLDLTGLEEMYGGDAKLALALQRSLLQGFRSRIGIGQGKFVAYLAAQLAETGSAFKAPPDAKAFVRQFPVECLPATAATIASLRQFGLKTLRDVASIGIGPLQTQFGPEGKRIWQLANGVDTRPLVPMKEEVLVSASMFLPYANVSLDMLLLGLESLSKKIFAQREIRGKYAGKADVELSSTGSPTWRRGYAFKERLGSPDKVVVAIKSRLLSDPPRFHVEELSLSLSDIAGENGSQGRLLTDVRGAGDGPVAELAQRLQTRTRGKPSLYRMVNVDPGHPLPEMRSVLVPLNPESADDVRPVNRPVQVQVIKHEQELAVLYPQKIAAERATVNALWRVDLWWMPTPTKRTYYGATSSQGKQITLFQDNVSGDWYLQRA